MGIYSEYLDKKLDWPRLNTERKRQLAKIAEIRDRPLLVYASAISKNAPVGIDYDDRVPFLDQLGGIGGSKLDLILETPGGLAEVVEDLVKSIRSRFSELTIIVPGWAKSAGTIMVMAADEIMMGPDSALGPIDAQMNRNGKQYAAHALLQGLNKIKNEVEETDQLNRAFIPILQNITPAEIQGCENAMRFAQTLVADWLYTYKFKSWKTHISTGLPVTLDEKKERASEIASILCDNGRWLTHSRSITMSDLVAPPIKLLINDYSQTPMLYDAIQRYYALLKMSFDSINMFKVYETPDSQIYRYATPQAGPGPIPGESKFVTVDLECPCCHKTTKIQANLRRGVALPRGVVLFPADNIFVCPFCQAKTMIGDLRKQIESQTKRRILQEVSHE